MFEVYDYVVGGPQCDFVKMLSSFKELENALLFLGRKCNGWTVYRTDESPEHLTKDPAKTILCFVDPHDELHGVYLIKKF